MGRTNLLAILTAGLAMSTPATAQSILDVQRALRALSPVMGQLVTATHNLTQMEEAVQGTPEFNAVDHVASTSFAYQGGVGETRVLGKILVNMSCPADIKYVRDELRTSAHFAVEGADAYIKGMNTFLTHLTTPAVVAEGEVPSVASRQ